MKPILLILVLGLVTVSGAKETAKKPAKDAAPQTPAAQPVTGPANDASIREYLALTRVQQEIAVFLDEGEKELKEATLIKVDPYGLPLNPSQKATIEKYKNNVTAFLRKELDWAKIEPQLLRFYRESYTQAQLEGVLGFLKSPVGRAYLTNEQDLARKLHTSTVDPVKEKLGLFLVALVTDLQNNSDYIRPDQREP